MDGVRLCQCWTLVTRRRALEFEKCRGQAHGWPPDTETNILIAIVKAASSVFPQQSMNQGQECKIMIGIAVAD